MTNVSRIALAYSPFLVLVAAAAIGAVHVAFYWAP
jgi:hypothetical protein